MARTIEELEDKDFEEIRICGRVGLTYKEVAYNCGVPIADIRMQFLEENGPVFEAWIQGRIQAELEIRQQVLSSAKSGSTPAMEQMLAFFKRADTIHREMVQ